MKHWLGLGQTTAVAGLHVSARELSMVIMRAGPLRITAAGRRNVTDAAVVGDPLNGDDVRLVGRLGTDLAELVSQLRLPPETGVVMTIEPATPTIDLSDGTGVVCPVRQTSHDRLVRAVQRCGLRIERVDAVPVALTRLAGLLGWPVTALQGAYGWTVIAAPAEAEAHRTGELEPASGPRLSVGPELASLEPLTLERLPIRVPGRLRSILDLDRDGVAIGAALAGLGLGPVADVRPVAQRGGGDWTVQSVALSCDSRR